MPSTLVVVDMQPNFAATRHLWLINNIKREIKKSFRRREPIVFLEYKYHGFTYECLKRIVRNYSHKDVAIKQNNNGAKELIDICVQRQFAMDKFRFVGVNTDCCVRDTVHGVLDRLPDAKLEVIKDCCNTVYLNRHSVWGSFRSNSNLRFVENGSRRCKTSHCDAK
jgi:nicotinamidase-related amidase